jgi:squalene synthase HpnC
MVSHRTSALEAPSGKDAAYENFPVGSFLLPAALRPHVAVFYAYARAIDDIADSATLAADEKVERLEGFALAVLGQTDDPAFAKAHAMRHTLAVTGVPPRHCLDLVSAFRQDATKHRYADWHELMDYCDRSAAPVGRFLVDLHGGSADGYRASDALCNALQVINHLQDCQEDFRTLDRVYLPMAWLEAEGASVLELDKPSVSPALRKVLDRCLDGVDELLAAAVALPRALHSRRLSLEAAAILHIARTLSRRLRLQDPLARKVKLGTFGYLGCCVRGAASAVV